MAYKFFNGNENWALDTAGYFSQMLCEHANECPATCPCESNCACKAGMCSDPERSAHFQPAPHPAFARRQGPDAVLVYGPGSERPATKLPPPEIVDAKVTVQWNGVSGTEATDRAAIEARKVMDVGSTPDDRQPKPTKGHQLGVWDLVIADVHAGILENPEPGIVKLMRARHEIGVKRYGTPLLPNNGRDVHQDIIEECLDALVYAKQAIVEHQMRLDELNAAPTTEQATYGEMLKHAYRSQWAVTQMFFRLAIVAKGLYFHIMTKQSTLIPPLPVEPAPFRREPPAKMLPAPIENVVSAELTTDSDSYQIAFSEFDHLYRIMSKARAGEIEGQLRLRLIDTYDGKAEIRLEWRPSGEVKNPRYKETLRDYEIAKAEHEAKVREYQAQLARALPRAIEAIEAAKAELERLQVLVK